MIANMGYTPSSEELDAAGMSDAQYRAYLNYYNSMNSSSSGGSGGRRRSKKKTEEEETSLYDQLLSQAKTQIDNGVDIEIVNGALARNVNTSGLTVNETRKILGEITDHAKTTGKLRR